MFKTSTHTENFILRTKYVLRTFTSGLDVAIVPISQGRFSHTKAFREVLVEHVSLLRIFVSCRAIPVKNRNGSFLFIHQFYSLPELFGIVWIEVSEKIIPLGPSQLAHNSISFSLIAVEGSSVSWLACTDYFVFSLL